MASSSSPALSADRLPTDQLSDRCWAPYAAAAQSWRRCRWPAEARAVAAPMPVGGTTCWEETSQWALEARSKVTLPAASAAAAAAKRKNSLASVLRDAEVALNHR